MEDDVRILSTANPLVRGLSNVTIISDDKAKIRAYIDRQTLLVFVQGGYAEFQWPPHRDYGGFYSKGRVYDPSAAVPL